jgi:hypothetical protein
MSAIVDDAEDIFDPELIDSKEKCEQRLLAIESMIAECFNVSLKDVRKCLLALYHSHELDEDVYIGEKQIALDWIWEIDQYNEWLNENSVRNNMDKYYT